MRSSMRDSGSRISSRARPQAQRSCAPTSSRDLPSGGAYRQAFARDAQIGRQPGTPTGAVTHVLPNPSGLQARYSLDALVELFRATRIEAEAVLRRP
jgi:G:T/U-mismatch repair DNA glycosylase